MLQRIAELLRRRDEGFTLIELMVVVFIIGILIAIAIPTFLGARARAQDRAAQSALRNTVTSAKTLYTDKEDYTTATVAALTAAEPSLTFADGSTSAGKSTTTNQVSVHGLNANSFYAASLSASGTCWYVEDSVAPGANPGTHWAKQASGAANCYAAYAETDKPTATDPGSANALP